MARPYYLGRFPKNVQQAARSLLREIAKAQHEAARYLEEYPADPHPPVQVVVMRGWPTTLAERALEEAYMIIGCDLPPVPAQMIPAPRPRPVRRTIPRDVQRAVWDRDDWRCRHCNTHKNLTVDHIVPLSKGGTDDLDNLQTLCGPCNSRKGDR